jgi:hypothetical protein
VPEREEEVEKEVEVEEDGDGKEEEEVEEVEEDDGGVDLSLYEEADAEAMDEDAEGENDMALHILHVSGEWVKRWEVDGSMVRVFFDCPVEDSYSLVVHSEMTLESTTCKVNVPVFKCRNVNREDGYLGIVGRTSIEISDLMHGCCSRVDEVELPAVLRQESTFPILLAYKFLSPNYVVRLDVKRHDDCEVLIAVCEECYLSISVTEVGVIMFNVFLKVRNTHKQFLRMTIPKEVGRFDIWSTFMSNEAVKPSLDEEKNVLIPLAKVKDSFQVKIVYVCEHDSLFRVARGDRKAPLPRSRRKYLEMFLPYFDLPVQRLFVGVSVPDNYMFGEFEGDLKEVENFSTSPVAHLMVTPTHVENPVVPMQQMQQMQMPSQMLMNVMDDFCLEQQEMPQVQCASSSSIPTIGFNVESQTIRMPRKRQVASDRGVVPVDVTMLQMRKTFHFERVLVSSETLRIAVPIRLKKKESWKRRSIFRQKHPWVAATGYSLLAIASVAGALWGWKG